MIPHRVGYPVVRGQLLHTLALWSNATAADATAGNNKVAED